MRTPAEIRADYYDRTRDQLDSLHKAAEEGRRRARLDREAAERAEEAAGNRWLAIHGRLWPMTEGEFADLKRHPIPEAASV